MLSLHTLELQEDFTVNKLSRLGWSNVSKDMTSASAAASTLSVSMAKESNIQELGIPSNSDDSNEASEQVAVLDFGAEAGTKAETEREAQTGTERQADAIEDIHKLFESYETSSAKSEGSGINCRPFGLKHEREDTNVAFADRL